jgi:S1-C subfamily serine protease
MGRDRYGADSTEAELAKYSGRELANCEQRLAAGDTSAYVALLDYWQARQDIPQVAAVYKTYVETGSDERELAAASGKLFALYSEGGPGLPADPDAAFHYLGLAREYDPAAFELRYANALYARGMYADAYAAFDSMLSRPVEQNVLNRSERCEAHLKMAELYFRGRGVKENWNIGYYYWLEGLSEAKDAAWGSCDKQTYYDHERYAHESRRRKEIERRLKAMGQVQSNKVRAAWESPEQGLETVAAMTFRRPLYREPVASPPARSPAPARTVVAATSPGSHQSWPPWRPVGGELCQWRTSFQPHRWSDVFQSRSGAIWSVKSNGNGAQAMGSAVAVSPRALVTNCHLIRDANNLTLLKVGSAVPARVIAADPEGDRCVLWASEALPDYVTAARRERDLLVGEDVAAIGNPRGLDTSLSRGLVAQKRNQNGRALIQTDAAISSGSSGGGLFDMSGNLVGITTFKVSSGESLNFAIAIDEFCR